MFRNRIYYQIKPVVPWVFRLAIRRCRALIKHKRCRDTWPTMPGSEQQAYGWPGWPNGKQFAFVLTHDIEGQAGLAKCRPLMELDRKLGFRASFNFIPEGYTVETIIALKLPTTPGGDTLRLLMLRAARIKLSLATKKPSP